MTYSNLIITKIKYKYNIPWEYFGTVDITTGFWLFKKTQTHQIFKAGVHWQFLTTGEYTYGSQVERLEEIQKATDGMSS